jgi:hypothetical protein
MTDEQLERAFNGWKTMKQAKVNGNETRHLNRTASQAQHTTQNADGIKKETLSLSNEGEEEC